jgi:hypothetical protein
MAKTQAACDWMSLSDQLDNWTRMGADGFQVLPYISASAGAVHLLCASEMGRVKIDWPTKDKECFYKYVRTYIQYMYTMYIQCVHMYLQ